MTVLGLKELQICSGRDSNADLGDHFREMATRAGLAGNTLAESIAEQAAQAFEQYACDNCADLENDIDTAKNRVEKLEDYIESLEEQISDLNTTIFNIEADVEYLQEELKAKS